ncbi:MAG: hypothetical protein ACJ73N_14010 [Bryobacteraceae bacterium]
MAEHEDQNTFPPCELASPLARARQVEAQHSLWVTDGRTPGDRYGMGGHERFCWQRARDLAWNSAQAQCRAGVCTAIGTATARCWPPYAWRAKKPGT